jgi:Ohr subfamily peroxiredoxin
MTPLYQARATASGGRNGRVVSDDGLLDLQLAIPEALGGNGGAFSNPEQLFAAGYAACFDSALAFVAGKTRQTITASSVEAAVGIGQNGQGGFALAVTLRVTIEGPTRKDAQALLEAAHQVCPYSNALRGNVTVELELQ